MALSAATDQQFHHLEGDGTADDRMEQGQGDDHHDMVSRDATPRHSRSEEDASWQAVKSAKQRNAKLERMRGSAGPQDQLKTDTSTYKQLPKLPALPKDDYKTVIRPNQGLPLKNVLTPTLAQAIIEARQAVTKDDQFILRINPGSNIATYRQNMRKLRTKCV